MIQPHVEGSRASFRESHDSSSTPTPTWPQLPREVWAKGAVDKVLRQRVSALLFVTRNFHLNVWLPWIKAALFGREWLGYRVGTSPSCMHVLGTCPLCPPSSCSWNMDAKDGAPGDLSDQVPQKWKPYTVDKQKGGLGVPDTRSTLDFCL